MTNNNRKESIAKIILLAEYANFINIFSKQNINILLEHFMHTLAIETKEKKKLPFDSMYNHLIIIKL